MKPQSQETGNSRIKCNELAVLIRFLPLSSASSKEKVTDAADEPDGY
jgi:hypothetical protein